MLDIQNLTAQIEGKTILQDISFSVRPGEIHALLGPNGAGKSTLGQVLMGAAHIKVTQGEIFFKGKDLLDLPPEKRAQNGLFLSFQSPPAIDGVSLQEILLGAKKCLDPDFHSTYRLKKSVLGELENMHLSKDFWEREFNKGFSGGERKKMEVLSLLTLRPSLAFLDEIDSGIDVDALQSIIQSLQKFQEKKETALIVVSHTEKLLKSLSPTHVHLLIDGKIKKTGEKDLLDHVHQKGFRAGENNF